MRIGPLSFDTIFVYFILLSEPITGTIGLEMYSQLKEPLDVVIIPVGGGGLISGIATFVKSVWPDVKIVAAEPKAVDDCKVSFEARRRIVTEKEYTVCDGVRTNIGKNAWPLIQQLVDQVITVSDSQVAKGLILPLPNNLFTKNFERFFEPFLIFFL